MKLMIALAWRNLWRNKMRSAVILLSISLGLFAGIFVLSLYQGMMEGRVKTLIEEETGHLQIHHPLFPNDLELSRTIDSSEKITDYLLSIQDVKAFSARTIAQGMLSTASGSSGVQIRGIIPEKENWISGLNNKIIHGRGFNAAKKQEVLIGKKLADKLKLHAGSKIILTMSDTENNLTAGA